MCCYCGAYPYWAYPPQLQYPAAYPSYAAYPTPTTYASYGIPLGYAYAPPLPPPVPALPAPAAYLAAPPLARGEHKVGNCLMICQ